MKMSQSIITDGVWDKPLNPGLDSSNTVSFVFFGPNVEMIKIIAQVKEALPNSHILGCSGAGEISNETLIDQKAIVTTAAFEKTKVACHSFSVGKVEECFNVGAQIAQKVNGDKLKGICVFSIGHNINGSRLMAGIRSQLAPKVTISGGLAGDGTRFQKTHVIHDKTYSDNLISVVAFYGDELLFVSHALGGWMPFGIDRKVTSAKDNILYSLDGKPALLLYKEFLGESAKKLPSSALYFPLLLLGDSKNTATQSSHNLVRTVLSVDEKNQSMTFAGDIPEGDTVKFMHSSEKSLLEAATQCAQNCLSELNPQEPTLSLMVSCVGRRIVLGSSTEDEIKNIYSLLPNGSLQAGFYSYGELAPGVSSVCDLHNQTCTLTWIQEKAS